MRKIVLPLVLFIICMAGSLTTQAQAFVYEPKNPAFGGNPYNYSWLQSSATAQDKTTDPNAVSPTDRLLRDPLEDFQESLNRQILNQLSRQLVVSQFGEEGLAPGKYTIGNYEIEVTEGGSGVSIFIQDIGTGNRTTVTIPYY